MKFLVLTFIIDLLSQSIFGADSATAKKARIDSPSFIEERGFNNRLPFGSFNRSFQLTTEERATVDKILEYGKLQKQIDELGFIFRDRKDHEQIQRKKLSKIYERDEVATCFYELKDQKKDETMLQVMKYMLLNFDFLGADIQHFKEFFDEHFDLSRASMADYLNFIKFKIKDHRVRVCNMEDFFMDPGSFLNGENQTIFLHKQSAPVGDPHYTAVVLYPHKYIEIIDSMKQNDPVYPRQLADELDHVISDFNRSCNSSERMMLVEHDVERQTRSGDCPYFAIFSALQSRYHDIWYQRLSEEENRFIFPMDAYQLSATCSLTRLNFLQRLFKQFSRLYPASQDKPFFLLEDHGSMRESCPSPLTDSTISFINKYYERSVLIFESQPDLCAVSLGCGTRDSSFNIAEPYIRQVSGGRMINGMIEALRHEFHCFRGATRDTSSI